MGMLVSGVDTYRENGATLVKSPLFLATPLGLSSFFSVWQILMSVKKSSSFPAPISGHILVAQRAMKLFLRR